MPSKVLKGAKGLPAYSKRGYVKENIVKPRRGGKRKKPIGQDPLEQRAAAVTGTILERIVFKRLTVIWGPPNVAFIYKYQVGAAEGIHDARAMAGGIEMDFVILNRPNGKEMDLEILGAHWHSAKDNWADQERALRMLATGRDYAEIMEYEVMMGDEFLDQRIIDAIGVVVGRVWEPKRLPLAPRIGIGEIQGL